MSASVPPPPGSLPKPPPAAQPTVLTVTTTRDVMDILAGDPSPARLNTALRRLAKWRATLLENTLVAKSGTTVLSGPFRGMTYALRATEGSRIARLLGAYEAGLAPVIETIIARAYPIVIDVGAAEGYYAVGLARRMPGSRILARDSDPAAQIRCGELAAANGVADRIEIGGHIGHADFAICAALPTVVLCDIEGAEDALLDPVAAPGLAHADILVEVHEGMMPGLIDRLQARFAPTHAITRIDRVLAPETLPAWTETLSDLDRLLLLWEWRSSPTPWLWMQRT